MKVMIVFEDVENGVRVSLEGFPEELPQEVPMSIILASLCVNRLHEEQESEKVIIH